MAGSDSGGGAGIQADARTIHALGAFAATAITAVTAQNSLAVRAWRPVPAELVAAQMEAVLEDIPVCAVKIGLLPAGAIRTVADVLMRWPRIPVVLDPVLGSTSGTRFLTASGLLALSRELLPLATLVTPNWSEAAALTGLPVASDTHAEAAARRLVANGCRAALVKGGHGRGRLARDCLATAGGRVRWFGSRRIESANTHGTGCVLSAAIAVRLARGAALTEAIAYARRFLVGSLIRNCGRRLGQGPGPAFPGGST
ncbi:MAG: bifunctional hydroxymethylpyrimidine kinase/phosphomethylpyrimidine kinase [Opitutaceae bacterium]